MVDRNDDATEIDEVRCNRSAIYDIHWPGRDSALPPLVRCGEHAKDMFVIACEMELPITVSTPPMDIQCGHEMELHNDRR